MELAMRVIHEQNSWSLLISEPAETLVKINDIS